MNHSKIMSIRRMTMPQGTIPLVQQIYKLIMYDPNHTLSSIAKAAGLAEGAVASWRNHHIPNVANFEAVLNALGYKLAIVPLKEPNQ